MKKSINDILIEIAFEYAKKFGYSLTKEEIYNPETDPHFLSRAKNKHLKTVRFEGQSDQENEKYPPYIEVRQRFGDPRLDMYWPKEGNKGRLAFVGVEFKEDGTFGEAQVFYPEGIGKLPEIVSLVRGRWEKEGGL